MFIVDSYLHTVARSMVSMQCEQMDDLRLFAFDEYTTNDCDHTGCMQPESMYAPTWDGGLTLPAA